MIKKEIDAYGNPETGIMTGIWKPWNDYRSAVISNAQEMKELNILRQKHVKRSFDKIS